MNINKIIKSINIDYEDIGKKIKEGKIFIFPTSTIYGIGTNAFNEKSVKKIYEIKKRDLNKPLIVLISNYDMLNEIVYPLNEIEKRLADKFWPGSLTMILKKRDIIPDIVTSSSDTVAVRFDENEIIRKIIDKADEPIVAPSANMSGEPFISDIKDLNKLLYEKVDYIIDAGKLPDNEESTLIKVENNKVLILREGKIKISSIKRCLKDVRVKLIK